MKKLILKLFGHKENIPQENVKEYNQIQDISEGEIEGLILAGKNEELMKIANSLGVDKIKCNSNSNQLASIHWAAGSGNLDFVSFLLSNEVNEDPNINKENNFTPLHAASMNGYSEIVELLIDKGANINVQTDPHKYAPIHSASFEGHLETIKLLVENGADLTLKNYRGEIPIDTAKRQNQLETIKYFEELKYKR